MTVPTKEMILKVQEALQEEAYKGIVRIDSQTMRQIDARAGDIVEIEGGRKTVGIVDRAYPSDIGQAIIRMDGIIRRNAKTGIGENIKVRKADVREAKSIMIAPAQQGVMIQANPEIFKQGLLGRAILKGDIISLGGTRRRRRTMTGSPFEDIFNVNLFEEVMSGFNPFGSLKFIVADTNPKTAVIITENTEVKVSSKSVEVTAEEKVPEVTYEDIGGLDEEIKKIREMVELPLRNPEIFERLGIEPPKGVLLHGPPGTGKTLLAKAVATETNANFLLVNGPELTSKFYGECVDKDTLIITNGLGISTIENAIENNNTHKIYGLDMNSQRTNLLKISDRYNLGEQETLKINTPHGSIILTPNSKLLTLNNLDLDWKDVDKVKEGDRIAIIKSIKIDQTAIPEIINYLPNNTYFIGDNLRMIFNYFNKKLSNAEVAKILGVTERKYEDWKYRKSAPAWVIKKLLDNVDKNELTVKELKLLGKGKIPLTINKDIMYLLGLLAGDGHLRYNYKDNHVSTIHLTNKDEKIIEEFKRILKENFDINDIKYDGKYGYYFSSSPIGTLLKNLGIPAKDKSHNLTVPDYLINLPEDMLTSYLRGLYDTDGHVHLVKSGKQISYYSMSEKMAYGVKLLLLRISIQTTIRKRADGIHELTIQDQDSIKIFYEKINFNNVFRKTQLEKPMMVRYKKPVFDRLPIKEFILNIKNKYNLSKNLLLKYGVNVYTDTVSKENISKFIELLKKYNIDEKTIEKLDILSKNDIIWTKVNNISKTKSHVYDFTVPNNQNFIANGFIVHNSEKRIRDLFDEAQKNAPSIIFIDEVDAIAPKREEVYGEVERRMVAQLLAVMDGMKSRGKVIVIAATNRPNSLDPALRRPGRFDREISIGVPNKWGRLKILKIHTRNMPLTKDVKLEQLSEITHGFVGADLEALCKEAAMAVLRKVLPDLRWKKDEPLPPEILAKLKVTMDDFKSALKIVRPSALREVLIETPNIKWEDIGGLEELKSQLIEAVELPIKNPEVFQRLGIRPTKGILMYGPPGTGKTLLAKAVAHESQSNFIYVKGPELLNKFVGESEKGVRKIFEKARQTAPCIIFFDEIDSLAPRRGIDFGTDVTERVVNSLLAEMDGLEELSEVVVIAATNRPDLVDPALLRPGRFDKIIATALPGKATRLQILKIHTKNMPLAKDVNIENLAERTDKFTGADLQALCKEAGLFALRKDINTKEVIKDDFEKALEKVKPSLRDEELKKYSEIEEKYLRVAKAAQLDAKKLSYFG